MNIDAWSILTGLERLLKEVKEENPDRYYFTDGEFETLRAAIESISENAPAYAEPTPWYGSLKRALFG